VLCDGDGYAGVVVWCRYTDGNHTYAVHVISGLLNEYSAVESRFTGGRTLELVVKQLRKEHKGDWSVVANIARAHHLLEQRNSLVTALLSIIERYTIDYPSNQVHRPSFVLI
jgi:hypothetical protein